MPVLKEIVDSIGDAGIWLKLRRALMVTRGAARPGAACAGGMYQRTLHLGAHAAVRHAAASVGIGAHAARSSRACRGASREETV